MRESHYVHPLGYLMQPMLPNELDVLEFLLHISNPRLLLQSPIKLESCLTLNDWVDRISVLSNYIGRFMMSPDSIEPAVNKRSCGRWHRNLYAWYRALSFRLFHCSYKDYLLLQRRLPQVVKLQKRFVGRTCIEHVPKSSYHEDPVLCPFVRSWHANYVS